MYKHSGIAAKLSFLLIGLFLLGSLLVVFSGAWKLRSVLLVQERQIYDLVLRDIVVKLEADLKNNTKLQDSKIAQKIIERHFNQIAPIKRICIFNPQGTVIFDTNRVFVGTDVPQEWVNKSLQDGDELWRAEFQMLRAADSSIKDSSGNAIAYILLLTEDVRLKGIGFKLIRYLSIYSIFVLLISLFFCVVLAVWAGKEFDSIIRPAVDDLTYLAYGSANHKLHKSYRPVAAETMAFTNPVADLLQDMGDAQDEMQRILNSQ